MPRTYEDYLCFEEMTQQYLTRPIDCDPSQSDEIDESTFTDKVSKAFSFNWQRSWKPVYLKTLNNRYPNRKFVFRKVVRVEEWVVGLGYEVK